MNRKGFTLIELVVTIALLAVVSTISFVSINAVIENSKERSCDAIVDNIALAAYEYASDNRYDFSGSLSNLEMKAASLVSNKYLNSGQIDDPYGDGTISPSDITIKISFNNDKTVNTITIVNNSLKCNKVRKFESD